MPTVVRGHETALMTRIVVIDLVPFLRPRSDEDALPDEEQPRRSLTTP